MNNRLVFEVERGSVGARSSGSSTVSSSSPTRSPRACRTRPAADRWPSRRRGSFNLWEIRNGGGGWVHPFHLHMEEHRTVMRNDRDVTLGDPAHPDDVSREDLVALDPGESTIIYRGFRTSSGPTSRTATTWRTRTTR